MIAALLTGVGPEIGKAERTRTGLFLYSHTLSLVNKILNLRSRTEDTERAVTRPNTNTPNQDDSTIWRELEALATATDEEDENLRRIRRSLPYSKLYSRLV